MLTTGDGIDPAFFDAQCRDTTGTTAFIAAPDCARCARANHFGDDDQPVQPATAS